MTDIKITRVHANAYGLTAEVEAVDGTGAPIFGFGATVRADERGASSRVTVSHPSIGAVSVADERTLVAVYGTACDVAECVEAWLATTEDSESLSRFEAIAGALRFFSLDMVRNELNRIRGTV